MTGAPVASRRSLAFVLPSFGGSGAERVLLGLLAGAVDRGVEARLVVFDPEGPLARLVPDGVSPIVLDRRRLRSALVPLVRTLRRLRPGVAFSTLGYVNLAIAAARPFLPRSTRLVLREANLPSLSLPEVRWPAAFRFGYRHLYRRADLVLATSERMAAEFRRDFALPDDRLAILPNPVDVAALRAAAAEPLRHPGAGVRLVAVGRLVRQKGFDRLIAMMANLPGPAHLSIAGDGPESEALAHGIETAGLTDRVSLVGYRSDVPRFLAGADALLMPSRWEACPMPRWRHWPAARR